MTWQEPKTDWVQNPKNPKSEDFNRIEGNIAELKVDIETKKGLIVDAINTMGQNALITDDHPTLASKIKDISDDANAVTTDVLPGKTFYQGGTKRTGDMPTKAAANITPGTANIVIPSGQYLAGDQTILGDPDLIAANIKAGANIFGVAGKASVVETSGGDAVAANILSGKKAYVNGALITGNIPSKAAAIITPGTTDQSIAAGQYLSGAQTIKGDPNLVAANILGGVNIFGVMGGAKNVAFGTARLPTGTNATSGLPVTVSGLGFTPTMVMCYTQQIDGSYYDFSKGIYFAFYYPAAGINEYILSGTRSSSGGWATSVGMARNVGNITVTNGSFTLPAVNTQSSTLNQVLYWVALS